MKYFLVYTSGIFRCKFYLMFRWSSDVVVDNSLGLKAVYKVSIVVLRKIWSWSPGMGSEASIFKAKASDL